MSKFLYNVFLGLYQLTIKLVSPFNSKAHAWLNGRKNIFQDLSATLTTNEKIVWMHCSSLGEFEQGRPLIEHIKNETPDDYKILITFFSPSGFEVTKDTEAADYVFYLPMDSSKNAKLFFDIVKPTLILFVKYEFWYYYLYEAKRRKVPLLLVSGIFRKDQSFFKWYGNLQREMLTCFTHFFVQNRQSAELLATIGITTNVTVSGDTRFDRVIKIAEQFKPIPLIEQFCGNANVVVAGSTWTEDDNELDHFANSNPAIKFIIAPHNTGKARITECQHLYKHSILYSQIQDGNIPENVNTLIIDNIGMLSRLYRYATICYVGGAFGGDGVHNVLEAAVYGKPVIFGPEYEKYFEAEELIETGGAISVDNALQLERELKKLLAKNGCYTKTCSASKAYVESKAGSTEKIMQYIYENRLLGSRP